MTRVGIIADPFMRILLIFSNLAAWSFPGCRAMLCRNQCAKMKPKYMRGPIGRFRPSLFTASSQSAFSVSRSASPTAYSTPTNGSTAKNGFLL